MKLFCEKWNAEREVIHKAHPARERKEGFLEKEPTIHWEGKVCNRLGSCYYELCYGSIVPI